MIRILAAVSGLALLLTGCSAAPSSAASAPLAGQGGSGYVLAPPAGEMGNLSGGKTELTPGLLDQIKNTSCSSWNSELELAPSLLEFVVDTSGSMSDFAPQSSQSKWVITRDAIGAAVEESLPDATGVGVLFFPNQATIPNHLDEDAGAASLPISSCVNVASMVAMAPIGARGSAQRAAIAQGFASVEPSGGTPTDDAYVYALSNGLKPALKAYSGRVPYMVLITDGQPTILQGCKGMGEPAHPVDWQPIVEHIREAAASLVKTFIIGAPGSNAQSVTGQDGRPWLSSAARVGQTARFENCSDDGPDYCHFDLSQSTDFATDLAAGLKEIISAIPCRFNMPSAPANCVLDSNTLNVVYGQNLRNGMAEKTWLLGQADSACIGGTSDGWYLDPDSQMLVLCPSTCRAVQLDQHPRLEIFSGCRSLLPPQ